MTPEKAYPNVKDSSSICVVRFFLCSLAARPYPRIRPPPQVSAAGIEEGLQSLAACGTPARTLIIDDGWQTIAPDPRYSGASITGALGALTALTAWINQTTVRSFCLSPSRASCGRASLPIPPEPGQHSTPETLPPS